MFQVQVQYHDTLAKNSAERWYLPFSSSRIIVVARKHEIVIFYTEILTGKVVLWCFFSSHTSCEDALKEKKISEQTTGQALFWTYFCIRICVEANDLATSKQGLVYITI